MKAILLVLFFLSVFCFPAKAEAQIRIMINGRELTTNTAPIVRSGQTLFPLRVILEALGATVLRNRETGEVTGRKHDREIVMSPNLHIVMVNRREVALDVPPTLFGGRVFVPLRFIAEALGKTVSWNGSLQTISIESDTLSVSMAVPESQGTQMQTSRSRMQMRTGVCGEFATLSAALLRAVGVQAKVVTGNTPEGYHAWNKAFDGSRWIEFDATFAATGKRDFFDRDLLKTHTARTTR